MLSSVNFELATSRANPGIDNRVAEEVTAIETSFIRYRKIYAKKMLTARALTDKKKMKCTFKVIRPAKMAGKAETRKLGLTSEASKRNLDRFHL
jgi:hypothetical protein